MYNGNMISVELAPNEEWDDALLSFSLLFQPWRWRNGPELEKVKEQLAEMVGESSEDVFLFLSGRAGLYHVLNTLELKHGSKVLVTGYTCEAVVLPIIANKLIPVYNDVSQTDYSIAPQNITPRISRSVSCLLIQHSYGIPPGRSALLDIAKKNDLVVIEDLAHGFEKVQFEKKSVKTVKLLSFGRSKSFSSVFGGAVVVSDDLLKKRLVEKSQRIYDVSGMELVKFLNYKWLSVLIKATYNVLGFGRALHRVCIFLGLLVPEISKKEKRGEYDTYFDKAYPNALAILLLHQLGKLDRKNTTRQEAVKIYRQALKGKIKDDYSLARFPVLVKDRDLLMEEGRRYGVYFGKWYTQPVAPAGLDLKKVAYERGSCPESEFICKHVINLPTNVSKETAKDIAAIVKPHLLEA